MKKDETLDEFTKESRRAMFVDELEGIIQCAVELFMRIDSASKLTDYEGERFAELLADLLVRKTLTFKGFFEALGFEVDGIEENEK